MFRGQTAAAVANHHGRVTRDGDMLGSNGWTSSMAGAALASGTGSAASGRYDDQNESIMALAWGKMDYKQQSPLPAAFEQETATAGSSSNKQGWLAERIQRSAARRKEQAKRHATFQQQLGRVGPPRGMRKHANEAEFRFYPEDVLGYAAQIRIHHQTLRMGQQRADPPQHGPPEATMSLVRALLVSIMGMMAHSGNDGQSEKVPKEHPLAHLFARRRNPNHVVKRPNTSEMAVNDSSLVDASTREELGGARAPFHHVLVADWPEDTRVFVVGDLHGNIFAIERILERLIDTGVLDLGTGEIKDPNTRLVFTGDLVDRGRYGYEVALAVLTLKRANPDRVIVLSGNHETWHSPRDSDFWREMQHKSVDPSVADMMYATFWTLPSALMASVGGKRKFYFCHAGLPSDASILREASQETTCSTAEERRVGPSGGNDSSLCPRVLPISLKERHHIEWSDFSCEPASIDRNMRMTQIRDLMRYKRETLRSMDENGINVVFRGHQHNDEMECRMLEHMNSTQGHGLVVLWNTKGSIDGSATVDVDAKNSVDSDNLLMNLFKKRPAAKAAAPAWHGDRRVWTLVSCGSIEPTDSALKLNDVSFVEVHKERIMHHWSGEECGVDESRGVHHGEGGCGWKVSIH